MSTVYNIYLSAFGAAKEDIDFSSPAYTVSDNPIIITDFTGGSVTDATCYICIRKEVDGIEEQNWNIIPFTLVSGQWVDGLVAVTDLRVAMRDGYIAVLSWKHSGSVCDAFEVYGNAVLLGTYPFDGMNYYTISLTISTETIFQVISVKNGVRSSNSNSVTVSPETTTPTDGAVIDTTWTDSATD